MQIDEAKKLQREWGDKPCGHPNVQKEYARGAQTGDFVCIQCGAIFDSLEEWEGLRQNT